MPVDAILLGNIKIGDNGFSVNCTYDEIIEIIKQKAREAGGNALKITEHKTPSSGSTCHRITATIISVTDDVLLSRAVEEKPIDQSLFDEGTAMIHFYRFGGMGWAISYNIVIGEETITRVKNNFKESVKVNAAGPVTLLARTESKSELNLDLQPGMHYYVRCSVTMGALVGHPKLELIDATTGKVEYGSIKDKKIKQ